MKFDKFPSVFHLLVITFLIALAGCSETNPSATIISREVVSSVGTIPATRAPAEQTSPPVIVAQTPIPVPSSTSTASIKSMPTAMPTIEAMVTETLSPNPTLTDTELRQLALKLFENNNHCQLPCWWGITPGKTTWDIAYELIRIFDPIPYRTGSEIMLYEPVIPLPIEVFGDSRVGQLYNVQNGVVIRISVPVAIGDIPEGYLTQYTLPAFLTTYGPPAEVWISTYSASGEGGVLPFYVILFYPQQGIVASYSSNGEEHGGFTQGCPQANPVSYLVLMPPDTNQTFRQAVGRASAFNMDYLSLEESTGMDITTFYETFKNPDNTICLETPANLWR